MCQTGARADEIRAGECRHEGARPLEVLPPLFGERRRRSFGDDIDAVGDASQLPAGTETSARVGVIPQRSEGGGRQGSARRKVHATTVAARTWAPQRPCGQPVVTVR